MTLNIALLKIADVILTIWRSGKIQRSILTLNLEMIKMSNNYIFTTKEKIMFRLISVLLGIGIGAVILSTL
tara:strand:- start:564 stop:776 length:213 start_codon:yes stop_codon:yes gene_type:complete